MAMDRGAVDRGGDARVQFPTRGRPRRSQAERTAETRGRILAAVVEAIAEVGYQKTTTTEIARRAGVTWGAVQHHFGGKEGILAAVLEESFDRFAARLAEAPAQGEALEPRVTRFLDAAWEHFSSAHYRSTFEILLNYAADESDPEPAWQREMLSAWSAIWSSWFADARLPKRRSVALQTHTISVLSGMAMLQILGGGAPRSRALELELLRDTLLKEFGSTG